jgi:riboflavin synthase
MKVESMFTGLVEEAATVDAIENGGDSIRLKLRSRVCAQEIAVGDSLAVNGCCLTVAQLGPRRRERLMGFDLLRETWERTNLQFLRQGARVNLERALRADARLGGHFVTGHIEGTAEITRWEPVGGDHLLEIRPPGELMRYLIHKGSVAVDGISLTVAEVCRTTFRIWIIPHTLAHTNLGSRAAGERVNIETDILGKYVERFVALGARSRKRGDPPER